jgi:hypothetical protein
MDDTVLQGHPLAHGTFSNFESAFNPARGHCGVILSTFSLQ